MAEMDLAQAVNVLKRELSHCERYNQGGSLIDATRVVVAALEQEKARADRLEAALAALPCADFPAGTGTCREHDGTGLWCEPCEARAALVAQGSASGPCSACGDGDVEQKYHKHVVAQGSASDA